MQGCRTIEHNFPYLFDESTGGDREGNKQSDSGGYAKFRKEYGWYYVLMQCADNDITKLDKILEINVIEFLTYLQYAKQKGELDIFYASLGK